MSVAEILEVVDDPAALDTAELACELVDLNTRLTVLCARWIALLAEFDRREGWRADGQLSLCGLAGLALWHEPEDRLRPSSSGP